MKNQEIFDKLKPHLVDVFTEELLKEFCKDIPLPEGMQPMIKEMLKNRVSRDIGQLAEDFSRHANGGKSNTSIDEDGDILYDVKVNSGTKRLLETVKLMQKGDEIILRAIDDKKGEGIQLAIGISQDLMLRQVARDAEEEHEGG